MATWQDMTEAERIQHSLKWNTDYAKQFSQSEIDNILSGNVSNGGMLTTGQPVDMNAAQPSQTFEQALEQQWAENPALLEQAIQQNPQAFQSGLLTGQEWYSNPTQWTGEIDTKNLGMTGLNEDDYRLFRSRLNSLNWNLEQGNIDEQQYRNSFAALTNQMNVPTVVQGTDKTYFLDPGVGMNLYDTNIKGSFGERPGMYRRHAKTEGTNLPNEFSEIAPIVAGGIGGLFGPVVAAAAAGGTSLATGADVQDALLQAAAAGTGATTGVPGIGGGSFTTASDVALDAALGAAASSGTTQYYQNENSGTNLAGSGVTPYETGVMPGSPPNDFKDVDMSDPSAVLDATRWVIDAGLPIPSWGMKWEDIKEWPATAWEEVQGWIKGSSNPLETVQKVFDVGIDKATDIVDKVIGGGAAIYDVLKDTFESEGQSNITDPTPPVSGAPEDDDISELPGDTTVEEDGLTLGQPEWYDPVGDDEVAEDIAAEDPATGQIVITQGPISEPGINPPEIAQPDELTTGGTVGGETPVSGTEDSPVSGSGGGAGAGFGEFEPFQAGISYDVPMLTRVNTELRNFLAELYNRG